MFEHFPLPVDKIRAAFMETDSPLVITAPTASGKSTRIPLWCAAKGSRTLVVEPRRTACRALCRYVQSEFKSHRIRAGYMVRHEQSDAEKADVLYVTPGIAMRMLQIQPAGVSDETVGLSPSIRDFGTIVIDEFHERSMENDLLLAVLKTGGESADEVQLPDVVVMSATIDVQRVSKWLGAKVLEAEGFTHKVRIHHLANSDTPDIPTVRGLEERVISGVESALRAMPEGDILVFLPGKAEIERCRRHLSRSLGIPTLKLHGDLPPKEQDLAFKPSTKRRAILSTNVAESSVTLPTVRSVVDSGLEKRTTYRHTKSVLSLMPISRESAEQRAGRAGRLGPGVVIRLWTKKGVLRHSTPPEILREDLDTLILKASALGRTLESLHFPDPPEPGPSKAGLKRLMHMNLMDANGRLTKTGRKAVCFPLDPMFSVLLVKAQKKDPRGDNLLRDTVDLVASLSAGGPFFIHGPHPGLEDKDGMNKAEPLKGFSVEETIEIRRITCDAKARILAMRGHPQLLRLTRKDRLEEARRIKTQLLSLLELKNKSEKAETLLESIDQKGLAETALTAIPHCAYIKKGKKFTSPGMEVALSPDSFINPETPAIAVLDTHSSRNRGFRVFHTATCCIPLSTRDIATRGMSEKTLVSVSQTASTSDRKNRKGRFFTDNIKDLAGLWSYTYAGREIHVEERCLSDEDSLEAAALLIRQGKVLPGTYEMIVENMHQTLLFFRSRSQNPPCDPNPEKWLKARLMELGLRKIQDLDLLCPQDLMPDLIDPLEMKVFGETHPSTLSLIDRTIHVEYDFKNRSVLLIHQSGREAPPPSAVQLPKWPGWSVTYKVHSRKWNLKTHH